MEQDFLRGSAQRQGAIVRLAATLVVTTLVAITAIGITSARRGEHGSKITIAIETPFVAPGVTTGSHVLLRGVAIGEVTGLDRADADTVRMALALEPGPAAHLTDTFSFDYRPENYFGVTAVNLFGGAGGARLASGHEFERAAAGDFTMA